MPGELVPRSYARDAYNILQGTELRTHTDALTAEQATRIKNSYDIQLHVGTHGIPGGDLMNPYALLDPPTQQEYDEASAVVDGMEPGDTLFLENYGFMGQPEPAVIIPDYLPATDNTSAIYKSFGKFALTMLHGVKDDARRQLEEQRQNYKISAWDYARQLATLKGIRTVYADHDVFEGASLQTLSKGKGILELMGSSDEQERALGWRMHTQRERGARNVMKDWALDHLPAAEAAAAKGRKPKLVLLFGGGHKEGLDQTFDDIGLDATITVMKSTNERDRAREQLERIAAYARAQAAAAIAAPTPEKVDADRASGQESLRARPSSTGGQTAKFGGNLSRLNRVAGTSGLSNKNS